MTYIEFYDNTAIENICSTMVDPPQRMVLIGANGTRLKSHARRYDEILTARGYDVEIITRSVSQNSVSEIVEALTEIIDKYDDCHIDLTGGGDLYLVAAGIVSEKCKDRNIRMHHFNLTYNSVVDCDLDGKPVTRNKMPSLSVEENIRVYGGSVISTEEDSDGMGAWIHSDAFDHDITAMWNICRKSPRAWNRQINVLAAVEAKKRQGTDNCMSSATIKNVDEFLAVRNEQTVLDNSILAQLYRRGLITYYEISDSRYRIKYKNEQIRQCLTKAGLVLELMVYHCAKKAMTSDGTPVYNDVRSGVCIDWDGVRDGRSLYETENEIDVMMMHGAIPVFVSCKNGAFTMEELYKLDTVASRFGRQYARKIIVATSLEKMGCTAEHIKQRAQDMGIRIVGKATSLSTAELIRTIGSFWN